MEHAFAPPNAPSKETARLGPDMMTLEQTQKVLGMDDGFYGEFGIVGPHLRKVTTNWAQDIPLQIVVDESTQDAMTIRDLNRLTAYVEQYVNEMTVGHFDETFEGALDGIAVIMRKHSINPGWATAAFTQAFDRAQQQIYRDTRAANNRVFPAALRCMTKIIALTLHLLNRRDHELNDATPQRGVPIV